VQYVTQITANLKEAAMPLFLLIVVVMGLALGIAFNNPQLKAAVKEHAVLLVMAAVLVFGGGTLLAFVLKGTTVPVPAGLTLGWIG
jgi:hypothetical protein